jgi:hypothetical protein
MRYDVHFSISDSCSQVKAVLPWRELYGVDRGLTLDFEHTFPLVEAYFFPYFDLAVISAGCYDTFVLGVSPSYLPARALMPILKMRF